MKKIFVVLFVGFAFFAGISSAKAQYGPYGFDAAMEWQQAQRLNQISAQTAMMQAEVLNYYQQQAAAATMHMMTNPFVPMPGVFTYDGVYITPETVNEYTKEKVSCDHCNNGYNSRYILCGGECKEIKSRCVYCHGTGYVTRTVRK